MIYYAIKLVLSALVIVAVSEIAKRHSGFAALVASLPLTSLLAFIWIYVETGRQEQIAELSGQIFWLVLPSLLLFIALPTLLRWGWGFWPGLLAACGLTAGAYLLMLSLLRRFGVEF
ncbi:MAG: DUF3147 family protein [Rhodocyclaceae bacterium]|nr:DUF3147 family protein [Rhodocyclaceae bacterium]